MATQTSSDGLEGMSLAAAKLARQQKRIEQHEASLTVPMLPEKDRQTSRGSGKGKWKPFDYTADSTTTASTYETAPQTSVAERRINTFRVAPTRESSLSRSLSSLSQQTEDGGFQLYTGRRRKGVEHLNAYEDNKPPDTQTTVEATVDTREIYDVFGNALPGTEFIEQTLGTRNGHVQFVQHPNGDVSAHQWSQIRYIWENIGQFSNIRKKIEGQLAADRLKGETASQTLQQNSLAYFRTVAKQREAAVMGVPFGTKEIQALLPEARATQPASPLPRKPVAEVEPTFQHLVRTTSKQEDTESVVSDSRRPAAADQYFSYEGYPGYTSYNSYQQYYGRPSQVPAATHTDRYYASSVAQDPFYSSNMYSDNHASHLLTYGAFTRGSERPQTLNYDYQFPQATARHQQLPTGRTVQHEPVTTPGANADGVRLLSDSTAPTSQPKPITPNSSRTAMREHLIKLGDQAKERSLSQANIRTVLYDPFGLSKVTAPDYVGRVESNEQDSSPELKKTVANPSGLPPRLHTLVSSARKPASSVATETLKDSTPDTYGSKHGSDLATPYVSASSQYNKPTPQSLKGPFFEDTDEVLCSASKKPVSKKTFEEELKDWWTNGTTFRRQEDFYNSIKASHRDFLGSSGSPATQAPIGTPAKKTAAKCDDPMTRLLIPVYENLASFVQGPEEKRHDYFSRWCQPPEWCIDRSPTGNNSFYDSEWGQPPARVGRDPRYRALPVEGVRFGAFGSPQRGSSLAVGAVGAVLDRRFAFGGSGVGRM